MNPLNSVNPTADTPVDVAAAIEPVAAFWAAHAARRPIAVHSSGTTGQSRTIVRSTASWVDSFGLAAARLDLSSAGRFYIPGPLSATMNLFPPPPPPPCRLPRRRRRGVVVAGSCRGYALHADSVRTWAGPGFWALVSWARGAGRRRRAAR